MMVVIMDLLFGQVRIDLKPSQPIATYFCSWEREKKEAVPMIFIDPAAL